jgi:hypothetical protein
MAWSRDYEERRATRNLDAHKRLDCRVILRLSNYQRGVRIAFEAARLVTLPTRAAPRTYTRKGVRYSVFAEDGVIWVVQQVEEAPR